MRTMLRTDAIMPSEEAVALTYKVEFGPCENCGCSQVSVHPDCERIECQICGYMMQSVPTKRDFDAGLEP